MPCVVEGHVRGVPFFLCGPPQEVLTGDPLHPSIVLRCRLRMCCVLSMLMPDLPGSLVRFVFFMIAGALSRWVFLVPAHHTKLDTHARFLQAKQLPTEDFANVPHDLVPMYSLALGENEDHLKIRLDAVGILLSYLGEEMAALRDKHSSWLSDTSLAGAR